MADFATVSLGPYLRSEFLRYREKGGWMAVGVLLYFAMYYFAVPRLLVILLEFLEQFSLPLTVQLALTIMTLHHICYILHCAVLRYFTYSQWAQKYRCNPKAVWPWESDAKLISRTHRTLLLNFFVIIPATAYTGVVSGRFVFPGGSQIPPVQEMLSHIIFCMCAEDVWSFVFHRINHYRLPYKWIHKKHHEYNVSIGMTAEYAHPVEYLITNIAAAAVGPIILGSRMQFVTFLTWLSYRIGDTVDQHGAFEFPWSPYSVLPFATTADFHDFHHSKNVGNYGSQFSLLDWLCGTSPFYYQHMLKKYEGHEKTK